MAFIFEFYDSFTEIVLMEIMISSIFNGNTYLSWTWIHNPNSKDNLELS